MKQYQFIEHVKNEYCLTDKITMLIWLFRTKLVDKSARLIRRPFYCRGRKWIKFGAGFTTGHNCRIEAFSTEQNSDIKISFGDNVQLNENVHISAMKNVSIGSNVLIASFVYISDNSHGVFSGELPHTPPGQRTVPVAPVEIESDCWIGEGVIIMPGVTIGKGSIIGAHSIVNADIPPACIAVGSPAKVIKKWDSNTNKWVKATNS